MLSPTRKLHHAASPSFFSPVATILCAPSGNARCSFNASPAAAVILIFFIGFGWVVAGFARD
jgi:hypothetical protein